MIKLRLYISLCTQPHALGARLRRAHCSLDHASQHFDCSTRACAWLVRSMALKPLDEQLASFQSKAARCASFARLPASLLPSDHPHASPETWLGWARDGGICAVFQAALGGCRISARTTVQSVVEPFVLTRLMKSEPTIDAVTAALMDVHDAARGIVDLLRSDKEPYYAADDCALSHAPA